MLGIMLDRDPAIVVEDPPSLTDEEKAVLLKRIREAVDLLGVTTRKTISLFQKAVVWVTETYMFQAQMGSPFVPEFNGHHTDFATTFRGFSKFIEKQEMDNLADDANAEF